VTVAGAECEPTWALERVVDNSTTEAVDLADLTLLPFAQSPVSLGQVYAMNLWLKANALLPNAAYLFRLECGSTASSVAGVTNGAPTGGVLVASPAAGVELTTLFTLNASSWVDDNLPISYSFGLFSSSGGRLRLRSRSLMAGAVGQKLPSGPNGGNVTVFVLVYDVYNATAEARAAVRVTKLPVQQAQSTALATLTSSLSSGSSSDIVEAFALASAVFGQIDCSSAPNCSALHRESCGSLSNTCGACRSGYVSDGVGDSNVACVAQSQSSAVEKSCPLDCSGRGVCVKQSVLAKAAVASCAVSNDTCEAVCRCSAGYGGDGCSLTAAQIQDKQTLTSAVLAGLSSVSAVDFESVASSVSSLVTTASDLSLTGVDRLVTALSPSVRALLAFSGSRDTSSEVDQLVGLLTPVAVALDVIAQSAGNASSSTAGVVQMLTQFGEVFARDVLPGQGARQVVSNDVRFTSHAVSTASIAAAYVVPVPRTSLENLTAVGASSVSIERSGVQADAASVSVQLTQLSPSVFAANVSAQAFARPVLVQTTGLDAVLVRLRGIRRAAAAPSPRNFSTLCRPGQNGTVRAFECPDSGEVLRHVCRGRLEVLFSTCPQRQLTCATIDGDAIDADDSCRVVSRGADGSVACRCDLASRRRRMRRRLSASGASDAMVLSSVLSFPAADDASSVEVPSNALSLGDDFAHSVTVYAMVASLWLVGLLVLFGCSYRVRASHASQRKDKERKVHFSLDESKSPVVLYARLQEYVRKVFPPVFSRNTSLLRLTAELKRNHRWLFFFTPSTGPESDRRRLLLGAKLLTFQSMLMCLLAVFYDLQAPGDDGRCGRQLDEASCVRWRSVFDADHSLCVWAPVTVQASASIRVDTGVCTYDETSVTFRSALAACVLVAAMTAIVARPIEYLFEVLLAPTVDEVKLRLSEGAVARIGRGLSTVAKRATAMASHFGQSLNRAAASTASARTTYVRARAGQVTRDIPEDVQSAHQAAHVSLSAVSQNVRSNMFERLLQRMRIQNSFADLGVSRDEDGVKADDPPHRAAPLAPEDDSISSSSLVGFLDDDDDDAAAAAQKAAEEDDGPLHEPLKESVLLQRQQIAPRVLLSVPTTTHGDQSSASSQIFAVPVTTPASYWGKSLRRLRQFVFGASDSAVDEFAVRQQVERDFAQLRLLLHNQRRLLKLHELVEFDRQWGLDPNTGEFLVRPYGRSVLAGRHPSVAKTVFREMLQVRLEAERKLQGLRVATEAHAGLEILHTFVVDLLGHDTTAAKIFALKSEEDFHHTRVVSRGAKFLAGLLLFGANLGFAYYVVTIGYTKSALWQHSFLVGCLVQLLVEVALLETIECVWLNFILPSLVARDVTRAYNALSETIAYLCAQSTDALRASQTKLNGHLINKRIFLHAPDFLFVSMHMTRAFPALLETLIVQAHAQYLPGKLARKWRRPSTLFGLRSIDADGDDEADAAPSWVDRLSVLRLLFGAFKVMATLPFFLQRIALRCVQPFVLAVLLSLWLQAVAHSVAYTVVFAFICGVAVALVAWQFYRESLRVKLVDPLPAELAQIAAAKATEEQAARTGASPVGALQKEQSGVSVMSDTRAAAASSAPGGLMFVVPYNSDNEDDGEDGPSYRFSPYGGPYGGLPSAAAQEPRMRKVSFSFYEQEQRIAAEDDGRGGGGGVVMTRQSFAASGASVLIVKDPPPRPVRAQRQLINTPIASPSASTSNLLRDGHLDPDDYDADGDGDGDLRVVFNEDLLHQPPPSRPAATAASAAGANRLLSIVAESSDKNAPPLAQRKRPQGGGFTWNPAQRPRVRVSYADLDEDEWLRERKLSDDGDEAERDVPPPPSPMSSGSHRSALGSCRSDLLDAACAEAKHGAGSDAENSWASLSTLSLYSM
jgi:hypothetical protein